MALLAAACLKVGIMDYEIITDVKASKNEVKSSRTSCDTNDGRQKSKLLYLAKRAL